MYSVIVFRKALRVISIIGVVSGRSVDPMPTKRRLPTKWDAARLLMLWKSHDEMEREIIKLERKFKDEQLDTEWLRRKAGIPG